MIKINIVDDSPDIYSIVTDEPITVFCSKYGVNIHRGLEISDTDEPCLVYEPKYYQGVEVIIAPERAVNDQ